MGNIEHDKVVAEGRYIDNGYYAPEICKLCHERKAKGFGGPKCCEHMACFYSPSDFAVLRSNAYTHEQRVIFFTEFLKLGKISIDMCCGKDWINGPLHFQTHRPDLDKIGNGDGHLFLRARCAGRNVIDFQYFMEKGHDYPCINWNPNSGCALTAEERPTGGRLLKPILKEFDGHKYCACEQLGEEELMSAWANLDIQLVLYDVYIAIRDLDIK